MEWWANHCEPPSVFEDYGRYIDAVRGALPSTAPTFLDRHTLHDAVVRQFAINLENQLVRVSADGFATVERPVAYDLEYRGVTDVVIAGSSDEALGGPPGLGHLGYHEFEPLASDLVEHRLLFSTGVEIQLRFREFSFGAEPRIDKPTAPRCDQ
jgi:hypothetical protein